jgi:hypothetical protein
LSARCVARDKGSVAGAPQGQNAAACWHNSGVNAASPASRKRIPQLIIRTQVRLWRGYLTARAYFGALIAFVLLQDQLGMASIRQVDATEYVRHLARLTGRGTG